MPEWKELGVDFPPPSGHVKNDLVSAGLDHTIVRHAHNRLFTVDVTVQCRVHVDVVVPFQVLVSGVSGGYRLPCTKGQEQGGQALLSIEEQVLRVHRLRQADPTKRPRAEAHVRVAALQRHHGADRIRAGHRSQKAHYVVVVPDPIPLKVGQLQPTFCGFIEELSERNLIAGELLLHCALPFRGESAHRWPATTALREPRFLPRGQPLHL